MAKKSRVRFEPKADPKCSARSKRQNHDRRCQSGGYEQHPKDRSQTGGFEPLQVQAPNYETAYKVQRCKLPLEARTLAQQAYINAIKTHSLTFGIGPAGTGKSYCAAAVAADALLAGTVERIILTRPAVEAGEQLGFLPGDVDEKYAVYIEAVRDTLNQRLGSGAVDYHLRHGRIVAAPLAYMRGKTFGEGTFVILDEAQNTTVAQMKMFLTRIGEHCQIVVNGDIKQSDIRGQNGLADAVNRVAGLADVYVHEFSRDDIVRSGLVRELMDRYEPPTYVEPVRVVRPVVVGPGHH
jgi:phosphate starvation-inducible PhoH-like protein